MLKIYGLGNINCYNKNKITNYSASKNNAIKDLLYLVNNYKIRKAKRLWIFDDYINRIEPTENINTNHHPNNNEYKNMPKLNAVIPSYTNCKYLEPIQILKNILNVTSIFWWKNVMKDSIHWFG